MATKYYGIKDNWTDDDLANVIEVASEDGSVSSVKVNGVEYGGGGGGDFTSASASIVFNTSESLEIDGLAYVDPTDDEFYTTDPQINTARTLTVALYKGGSTWFYMSATHDAEIAISGDITEDNGAYQITGTCTITINEG